MFFRPGGLRDNKATQGCPCGYRNDPKRECACIPAQIQRYLARISGPLLERIDIHIEVLPVPFVELSSNTSAEASNRVRRRVDAGRFHKVPDVYNNAQMPPELLKRFC